MGNPQDICQAALFLINQAPYITGQIIQRRRWQDTQSIALRPFIALPGETATGHAKRNRLSKVLTLCCHAINRYSVCHYPVTLDRRLFLCEWQQHYVPAHNLFAAIKRPHIHRRNHRSTHRYPELSAEFGPLRRAPILIFDLFNQLN